MPNLFNVPISITSKDEALATVSLWLTERTKDELHPSSFGLKLITTPNPEIIVAAQTDPEFLKALQAADLAIPDGVGVVWAIRLLGLKAKGQGTREKSSTLRPQPLSLSPSYISLLSGLDLMESLIAEAAGKGWKVLLLGGKPGIAKKVSAGLYRKFRIQNSELRIKSISGPQNIFTISSLDNDSLVSEINSFAPDLLFVAFGHGKQEKWLNVNRHRLNAGVAMGVGGALDQIADPGLRPPAYINSIGLGWLYRLFRQPWRWRRQLALVKFAGMVIKLKAQISKIKA